MPVILSAAFLALGVLLAGSLPWGVLTYANQRYASQWPWAVPVMMLYLGIYWQVVRGRWAPRDWSDDARVLVRANPLSVRLWPLALGAGLTGFLALLAMLSVMARLVAMPAGTAITMPVDMPVATVLMLLAMQSVVAGVTEETAFRGYMQSLVEQRFGLMAAILANGTWFGLLHFSSHPGAVLLMLPYYIAVAAVYGGLTWATNSILPAMLLHVIGDVVVLWRWWVTSLPEWQLTDTPLPLLASSGVDREFMLAVVLTGLFSGITLVCYRLLHRKLAPA